MTREEAKRFTWESSNLKYDEIIDEIYNSLDKQKCPSCKYEHLDSARYLAIHKCSMGVQNIDYDFGCSFWKAKEPK